MTQTLPSPDSVPADRVEEVITDLATSDLGAFGLSFNHLRNEFPREVIRGCLRHISNHGSDCAAKQMLPWVSVNPYFELLLDPKFLPINKAQCVAEVLRLADVRFFLNFPRLTQDPEPGAKYVPLSRALTLVERLGDYEVLLPWLRSLTRHPDIRIQSKAVKVLCGLRPNITLILRHMKSEDARIRANAIEALWFAQSAEGVSILRHGVSDKHHRVVVNALVGLYCQNEAGTLDKLLALSEHLSQLYRRAAIWAFGQIRDPRAIPALERMVNDPSELVRAKASAALASVSSMGGETAEQSQDPAASSDPQS